MCLECEICRCDSETRCVGSTPFPRRRWSSCCPRTHLALEAKLDWPLRVKARLNTLRKRLHKTQRRVPQIHRRQERFKEAKERFYEKRTRQEARVKKYIADKTPKRTHAAIKFRQDLRASLVKIPEKISALSDVEWPDDSDTSGGSDENEYYQNE